MENNIEIKKNNTNNRYKITTIIFIIISILLIIMNVTQSIVFFNQGVIISYNGISTSGTQAYINVLIENKSNNDVFIAYNNFSIKADNSFAITPDTMYIYGIFSDNASQTFSCNASSHCSTRIKLNYDKDKIPLHASLYYNGKKIADL